MVTKQCMMTYAHFLMPRQGEPRWTEISRIASLTFLAILFCVLLGFMLRQVFTSPTVMQRYLDPSNFVDVPGKDWLSCFCIHALTSRSSQ